MIVFISLFSISTTLLIENKKIDSSSSIEFSDQYISELVNDCNSAENWVKLNLDNLPVNYSDLVRFPDLYKRYIYDHMNPQEKYSIWFNHFSSYINSGRLDEDQVTRLNEIITNLNSSSFDPQNSQYIISILNEEDLKLQFENHAENIFTLSNIGSLNEHNFESLTSLSTGDCGCRVGGILTDCGFGNYICSGENVCNNVSGCGLLGLQQCTGNCLDATIPGED